MFEVRPHGSDPSTRIQFDGASMRDGYPAELEMAQGRAFINNEPFPDPGGKLVTLNAAEAGALALTSSGMHKSEICERLDLWFSCGPEPLRSLYGKLGARGVRPDSVIVSAAFEKGLYLPDEPPCLTPIRESYRQRFFDLTTGLSRGAGLAEIGKPLNLKLGAMSLAEHKIAEDLGLGYLKRPGAALVFLAGTAERLPTQASHGHSDVTVLFPEAPTQKLLYNPTEDPTVVFRFAGQPLDRSEPDVRAGYVDRVTLGGAVVGVQNKPFVNYANELTELQPIELTAVLLKCVLSTLEVQALTGHNSYTGYGPLLRAYDKLLPRPQEEAFRKSAIVPALHELFRHGILTGERGPDLSHLPEHIRNRFYPITRGLAEAKPRAEIAAEIGASVSTMRTLVWELRKGLKLSTAGIVLASEARTWLNMSRSGIGLEVA